MFSFGNSDKKVILQLGIVHPQAKESSCAKSGQCLLGDQ